MKSLVVMVVALSAVLAQAADPTPAEKLGWTVAVHSYTFRKFSIYEAIDKTAALGLKHMSVSGTVMMPGKKAGAVDGLATPDLTDAQFGQIKQKMVSAGLDPVFTNMGVVHPTSDEAKSRKIFEAARKMGIPILVAEPEPDGKKLENLPGVMDVVEKLAKEYNIKVAIHNHPKPSFYWNPDTVLAAVKGRSELLGACADTGHWVRSGLDPVECLKKLEGRVITLHFKDLAEKTAKTHDVPWGKGISNIHGQMAELKRQGFKGTFCVEYETNWDNSSPEIAEGIKYFNKVCEELAGK